MAFGFAELPSDGRGEETSRWTQALARLGGRRDLLAQLARSYSTGLPDLLGDLKDAANQNSPDEVARIAHLLAGQAGNFDACELSSTAKSLEEAALANSIDHSLVAKLAAKCRELDVELNYWRPNAPLPVR